MPLRSIFTVQTCLFPSSVVYKSTSSPRTNGHASVKRARDALREVELANDLVKQLQPYLRAQYQSARQKVNTLRLRTRFTSLPKNVLSEVLVLATRPRYVSSRTVLDVDEEMQSIKQARTSFPCLSTVPLDHTQQNSYLEHHIRTHGRRQ